jgi:hypothetical protein
MRNETPIDKVIRPTWLVYVIDLAFNTVCAAHVQIKAGLRPTNIAGANAKIAWCG